MMIGKAESVTQCWWGSCSRSRGSALFLALHEMCISNGALKIFLNAAVKLVDTAGHTVCCGLTTMSNVSGFIVTLL